MPVFVLFIILIISSWLFTQALVLIPLHWLGLFNLATWLILAAIAFLFSWCFGE